jgi:UDP-glucose 4-epimerase
VKKNKDHLKIIVTGAAGFIGSHLCEALLKRGHYVTGLDDLSFGSLNNLSEITDHNRFKFVQTKVESLSVWVEKADVLVHLASKKIPRYDNSWSTVQENITGTQAVVNYTIKSQCKLIFASTSDVYGKNPITPYTEESDLLLGSSAIKRWSYAASKIAGEHLIIGAAEEFRFDYAILRFFGTYGQRHHLSWWGGPQSEFIEKILSKESVEIHGTGEQIRSFIYIEDLVKGIEAAIEKVGIKGIFNLCQKPEDAVSIKELAKMIGEIVNPEKTPALTYIPYTNFGNYEDVMKRTGLYQKAKTTFGFEPTISLREGLKRTISWHQSLRK